MIPQQAPPSIYDSQSQAERTRDFVHLLRSLQNPPDHLKASFSCLIPCLEAFVLLLTLDTNKPYAFSMSNTIVNYACMQWWQVPSFERLEVGSQLEQPALYGASNISSMQILLAEDTEMAGYH